MTTQAPAGRPGRADSLLPWAIRLERRLEVPRWLPVMTTIGAVIVALVISGVILWIAAVSYTHLTLPTIYSV